MMDHQTGFQRIEDIVARFDLLITEKASKKAVNDLQDFVDRNLNKDDG